MAIRLSELIELLNKELALEYTAMVQYVQHSDVLTCTELGVVAAQSSKRKNNKIKKEVKNG